MTFTIEELKEQVAAYRQQEAQGQAILTQATVAIRVIEHQIAVLEERKAQAENPQNPQNPQEPITDEPQGDNNAAQEGNE